MKYKLKTRLFAALALSGVCFYWPASRLVAQEDGFGFIRPAESTRQDDQELSNPPIVQASTPLELLQPSSAVRPPAAVVQSPQTRRSPASSTPVPFASSNVFNGAYVEAGNAAVGQAEHQLPSQGLQQATVKQVSHQSPIPATELPPILQSGHAERDIPPIVQSNNSVVPRIVQPIEQSDLPPIVPPNAGVNRLLNRIQPSDQSETLITADGASVDEASSVQPAGFGAGPLLMQDAPPIVGSIVEGSVLGELPSVDGGALVPVDPAVNLLGEGNFPRTTVVPQPTFEPALPQQAPAFGGSSTRGSSAGSSTRDSGAGSSTRGSSAGSSTRGSRAGSSTRDSGGGSSTRDSGGGHGAGVSACSSCGENGCFDPEQVESIFNSSGANAYARRYAIAEVLYFDRTEGQINNSNFGSLNNFDPGAGARITVGRRTDSTRGFEFQYSGLDAAEQTLQVLQPTGLAQSQFVPTGGLNFGNLESFFNATEQSQSAETYFHSLEFNRVKWGWDVIKSYFGFRYIYVDDEYTLFSQSLGLAGGSPTPAESGFFQLAATNHLIGPHIGGELYYDIGYRWSLSGVSRLGAYLNINTFDTNLVNDGTEFINAEDTNSTISFTYEIGVNAKYRLTRQAQFRIGYNILFFDNLATASDNLLNDPAFGGGIPVSPTLGSSTTDEESVLFHGLSLGFEIYR